MGKIKLKIGGMTCKSCEMLITDSLDDLGVKAKVSHNKGTADIEFDESEVKLEKIKAAIKADGFSVE